MVDDAVHDRISALYQAMGLNILLLILFAYGLWKLHEQELIDEMMKRNDDEANQDEQILNEKQYSNFDQIGMNTSTLYDGNQNSEENLLNESSLSA